jgi:hypothetical protein
LTARGVLRVEEVDRKKFRKESTRLTGFLVAFVGGGADGSVDRLLPFEPKWYFRDGEAMRNLRAASESPSFSNLGSISEFTDTISIRSDLK